AIEARSLLEVARLPRVDGAREHGRPGRGARGDSQQQERRQSEPHSDDRGARRTSCPLPVFSMVSPDLVEHRCTTVAGTPYGTASEGWLARGGGAGNVRMLRACSGRAGWWCASI